MINYVGYFFWLIFRIKILIFWTLILNNFIKNINKFMLIHFLLKVKMMGMN